MPVTISYPEGNVPDTAPTVQIYRADTFKVLFANVQGLDPGRIKLWFTLKKSALDDDSAALCQVTEAGGAVVLNGAPAGGNTGLAVLTVVAAGTVGSNDAQVQVRIDFPVTAAFDAMAGGAFSLKEVRSNGREHTHLVGVAQVIAVATRATA